MRENNLLESTEEFWGENKTKRRQAKQTTKMKMTGKGMKRFALPGGKQTSSQKQKPTN